MGDHSKIEWTDATWPLVTGCTKVSEGCRHCYAIRDGWRLSHHPNPKVSAPYAGVVEQRTNKAETWRDWSGVVKVHADRLDWPLRWKRPRRIFVCNESDLFHEGVSDEFLDRVFAVMATSGRHQFQVLTKRPRRMLTYLLSRRLDETEYWPRPVWAKMDLDRFSDVVPTWPLSNVWLGVSVEDQRTAEERIPLLLQTPAAVRFVSAEPLLGSVDFSQWIKPLEFAVCWEKGYVPTDRARQAFGAPVKAAAKQAGWTRLDWVIVGGESGPQARPCDVAWIRSVVAQCRVAQVPCFVKQLGAHPSFRLDDEERRGNAMPWFHHAHGELFCKKLHDPKGGDQAEWPEDLRVREFPTQGRGSVQATAQLFE